MFDSLTSTLAKNGPNAASFNFMANAVVDDLTQAGYIVADRHDLTEAFWAVVNSHTGNGKTAPSVAEIIAGVIDRFPGSESMTRSERRARHLDSVTPNSIAHVKELTTELHGVREHFKKRIELLRSASKLRAPRVPSNRTITIDIETGHWVTGQSLKGDDGARIASSVMPGWPIEEIARAYGEWMSADPAPGSFAGRIANIENQLEGLRERVESDRVKIVADALTGSPQSVACEVVDRLVGSIDLDDPNPRLHWEKREDGTVDNVINLDEPVQQPLFTTQDSDGTLRDHCLTANGLVVGMPRVAFTGEKRTVETAEPDERAEISKRRVAVALTKLTSLYEADAVNYVGRIMTSAPWVARRGCEPDVAEEIVRHKIVSRPGAGGTTPAYCICGHRFGTWDNINDAAATHIRHEIVRMLEDGAE